MARQQFDWASLLRAGIGGLRLTPDQFWDLTPAELKMMLGVVDSAAMQRDGLEALMQAFPDTDAGDVTNNQGAEQ